MARAVLWGFASVALWVVLVVALFSRPREARGPLRIADSGGDMGLKTRILQVTQLESGGPRNKNVLRSLARSPVQVEKFDEIFDEMLAQREFVKYSDRRQAIYGPPGLRRRRGGSFVRVH